MVIDKKSILTITLLFVVLFKSMAQIGEVSFSSPYQYYLHLAHTRTAENPSMDQLVENMDYSCYDMLWLGGDMAVSSSLDDMTMDHIDSILDVGNENTLWALGNHDYADLDRISAYTHRPAYYAYYKDKLTFLVLDTQDSLSNIVGEQLELFFNVIDTLQSTSHLIILTHKLIWMYGDSYLENYINTIPNGGFGNCFSCTNPNNFYTDLYPKLLEVEAHGIEVICIAGDIGFRRNEFSYTTPEGVQFLASGIEAGRSNNQALVFKHGVDSDSLSWTFTLLSDLDNQCDTTVPTGLVEISEADFHLYPNPSTGLIRWSSELDILGIEVCNQSGAILKNITSPGSGFIDLGREAPGVYFIRFYCSGDRTFTKRVLID